MRRAIAADFHSLGGVEVVMTLDRRFAGEPNPWETVLVGPGLEREIFQHLANQVDYIVCIAPETDGILEARAGWIETSRAVSLGSTRKAIRLAANKLGLAEYLEGKGIATPPTRSFRVAEGLPVDLAFPMVIKPIDGAGAQSTFMIRTPGQWPVAEDLPEVMVAQPFVAGIPLSASFMVDREGSARLLGVGRQHIAFEGLRVCYHGGSMPEPDAMALGAPRAAVEAVEGLRGFVGVDFIVDGESGATTVIEINPRPTTSFVGLQHRFGVGAIAVTWLSALGHADSKPRKPTSGTAETFRFFADGTIARESLL